MARVVAAKAEAAKVAVAARNSHQNIRDAYSITYGYSQPNARAN